MADLNDIRAIFQAAEAKHNAAVEAKNAMADAMLSAFQALMPPGTILDLRYDRGNPPPAYLSRVRTMKGNDR